MSPLLEIFSQGEEVVTGQIADTNAAWLSEQAVQLGFTITRHTAVGDKLDDLVNLFKEIAQRADCCICTGGLGPTSDDLTAEAVAIASQQALEFDEIAYRQIAEFFKNRNKAMPDTNRKQAMLPKTALRLDNHWGTAPGFALQYQRCWFVFLPGVPSEMKEIFRHSVVPLMKQWFVLAPKSLVTIKTIGIGESEIQQRLDSISLPEQVQLGFRADIGEVQTKLLFPAEYPAQAKQAICDQIASLLGDFVYLIDDSLNSSKNLYSLIDQLMTKQLRSLLLLETVSQGYINSFCLGATWLKESQYQSNMAKLQTQFKISTTINDNLSLAKAIAVTKLEGSSTDLILVQLVDGEQSDLTNPEKNMTITTVIMSKDAETHQTDLIYGSAIRKQRLAGLMALDLLRRFLQTQS